jgi:TatD DNase family protein
MPYRGKRNESSYLCIINNKVAEILGLSIEEAASVTYGNSVQIFGL